MNAYPYPDHGINDPDIQPELDADIGLSAHQRLPTAEAVLAATLALMTGHAQACCEEHRWVMLRKIVANLHLLAHHPGLSAGFKTVAEQLHAMWGRLRDQKPASEPGDRHESRHESDHAAEPARSTPPGTLATGATQTAQTSQSLITQPRVLWHASPEIIQ